MVRSRFSFKGFWLALAFFSFLFVAAPALPAPAIDKADAERLRAVFTRILNHYKNAAEAQGGQMDMEGATTVEPADSYYAVTLPHITYVSSDGSRIELGMVAVNAAPGDKPDQWKMTVAIPTPIVDYDDSGTVRGIVDIGAQNLAGVWSEKFDGFIVINAHYKDISIKDTGNAPHIRIPDMTLSGNLAETAPGLWSGPLDCVISGLNVGLDKRADTTTIGKITLSGAVKDYAVDSVSDYREKVAALNESYKAGDPQGTSHAHALAFYNLVGNFLMTAWDGLSMNAALENFKISYPSSPGTPGSSFSIGVAGMGMTISGFRSGNITLDATAQYKDIKVTPPPEEFEATAPVNMNMDVGLSNLPLKEILDLGRTLLPAKEKAPEDGDLGALRVFLTLPQILTKSRSTATIRGFSLGNDHYNIALKGDFTTNIKAQYSATGKAHAEITGLDYLVSSLRSRLKKPDLNKERKQTLDDMLRTLTVLQISGQKDTAKPARRLYDFELNEQGQALLNGTDIGTLFPLAAPVEEKPAAPPPKRKKGKPPPHR